MKNLIAVVTGGTRGIGMGIAESLLKRGASLAITYRGNEPAAESAKQHLESLLGEGQRLLLLKGDGGDPDVVEKQHRNIRDNLGAVNVLVNNAGIMSKRAFDEISVEEWNETLRVNLSGAFYWSSQVIPGMKEGGYGRIVNVTSVAARGVGVLGPHYAASKAGLLGMTRHGARELGPFGITVNAIAPAFIEDAGVFLQWTEEQKAPIREKILVSRLGNVADVARAFEYLLDSPFVTGVTLDVNGGVFMI